MESFFDGGVGEDCLSPPRRTSSAAAQKIVMNARPGCFSFASPAMAGLAGGAGAPAPCEQANFCYNIDTYACRETFFLLRNECLFFIPGSEPPVPGKEIAMKKMLLVLALAPVLAGCAGVDVKQDYDTSIDFQQLKTYAWQPQIYTEPNNEQADNSLVTGRVQNSVDAVLSTKGYQTRVSGDVDFLAAYNYTITKELDSGNGTSTSVGVGSSISGGFGAIGLGFGHRERNAEMATLSIDIINPKTGKLMWRGFVQQELIRRSDPNQSAEDIKRTVEAILSKFPPKRKAR